MALKSKDIFTVIEFGTSKISALHAGCDKGGNPVVYGFGARESAGAVVKGEIKDFNKAVAILSDALNDADKSTGTEVDRGNVYVLVSGPGISSRQGEGTVMIYGQDKRITQAVVDESVSKAMSLSLPPELLDLDSFTSYFVLDANTRVRDPLEQSANRLDTMVHIIIGERNRIETIKSAVRELGFETPAVPVFSGVASAYGVLSKEEKEQGTLLIDMGAGVSDYMFVHDDGVLMSGVVPVGLDNLANDLAIAFDLNIDQGRRIVADGVLEKTRRSGEGFFDFPVSGDTKRRIPLGSLEKIIELRMHETFSIIKEEVEMRKLAGYMPGGVVVTGGGALVPSVAECARNVTGTHVRRGLPLAFTGALTGLDNPRYSSVLGVIRYVLDMQEAGVAGIGIEKVADAFENITGGFMNKFKSVTKVFKKS